MAPAETTTVPSEEEMSRSGAALEDAPLEGEEPEPESEGESVAELEEEPVSPTPEQLAKVERENTRHERELRKIIGEDFRYFGLCPSCDGFGYRPVPPDLGGELVQDEYLETCDRCQGHGAVRTGARESALFSVPCPGCGGKGYTQKQEYPNAQPDLHPIPVQVNQQPAPAPPDPNAAQYVEALRSAGYVVVAPPAAPAV